MGSKKDVSVTQHSSLNPNAAVFVPASLRAANAIANSSVGQRSGSPADNGVSGFTTGNSSSDIRIDVDQSQQHLQSLLPDDITPRFDSLGHDTTGRLSLEDEHEVDPIETLVSSFPDYSKESLEHIFIAHDCNLGDTIFALHELECQDDSLPEWESNMDFVTGHTMDPDVGASSSVQVGPSFALNRTVANGSRIQTPSFSPRMHQQPSHVAVNVGQTVGTTNLLSNLGERTYIHPAQNPYTMQDRKANLSARGQIIQGQLHDRTLRLAASGDREVLYSQRNVASANLYNDAARNRREINLQGYDVNAAMQRLKEVISGLQYSTWQTCQPQLLLIKLGESAAGLLYAVLHLLEEAKLHWFEAETGILEVLIS